jgi:D-glycero-D-manno-heptose 1,7-bisphosphate phosphatase
MLKRPAVFFDRDNTLIASDGYLGDPSKVVLVEGAADAIARLRALGFRIVVVSNQSGVARGMFTEDAVRAVNDRINELLRADNPRAVVDRHEFCPFHPEATVDEYRQDSALRKPKPGMILAAAETMVLDPARSWMVGDAPRDIEAGKAAGCRTILFRDPSLPASPAAEADSTATPDFTVATLKEAVDQIEREVAKAHKPKILPAPTTATLIAPPPHKSTYSISLRPPSDADFVDGAEVNGSSAKSSAPRLEVLTEQILQHLRQRDEHHDTDFSVTKLLAGIVQIISLAVLLLAYIQGKGNPQNYILVALTLQTFTISLLIMGRQR